MKITYVNQKRFTWIFTRVLIATRYLGRLLRIVSSLPDSSGVYICKPIVNDLWHGNFTCKPEVNYLPAVFLEFNEILKHKTNATRVIHKIFTFLGHLIEIFAKLRLSFLLNLINFQFFSNYLVFSKKKNYKSYKTILVFICTCNNLHAQNNFSSSLLSSRVSIHLCMIDAATMSYWKSSPINCMCPMYRNLRTYFFSSLCWKVRFKGCIKTMDGMKLRKILIIITSSSRISSRDAISADATSRSTSNSSLHLSRRARRKAPPSSSLLELILSWTCFCNKI